MRRKVVCNSCGHEYFSELLLAIERCPRCNSGDVRVKVGLGDLTSQLPKVVVQEEPKPKKPRKPKKPKRKRKYRKKKKDPDRTKPIVPDVIK